MTNFHQYDPYEIIQQLQQRAETSDGYVLQMAQMMEDIAQAGKQQAEHLQRGDHLLRHVFKLLQQQYDLIIKMEQRIQQLEKK
jgi:hypothetical protein